MPSVAADADLGTTENMNDTVVKDDVVDGVGRCACRLLASGLHGRRNPAERRRARRTTAGPASRSAARAAGLSKSFGAVQALVGVDLDVPAGQVTALVGDNGAGKSVLIKYDRRHPPPDGGEILWEGRRSTIRTPRDAAALGIETVYQDLALCDNLDIVQNMFLGRETSARARCSTRRTMEKAAGETLASLAVTTVRSIRQPVASLSGGQRQSVAIAKAVLWNSKLVIMDEPTAALGVAQTAHGARPRAAARRPRARGAARVPQHERRVRGRRPDRGAAPRAAGRGAAGRRARPQIVVDLMTTGVGRRARRRRRDGRAGATTVPASRATPRRRRRRRGRRSHARPRSADAAVAAARSSPTRSATTCRGGDAPAVGRQTGVLPGHRRAAS